MARCALLVGALAAAVAGATRLPSFTARSPAAHASKLLQKQLALGDAPHYAYVWEEKYFPQFVDQFNFMGQTSAATFQQRYLINASWWKGNTAPIFFYAGNEGDITLFANNTGIMWTLAQEMGALVVFAEHRYYGVSLPYGDASYDIANLGALSIEQALLDYVNLVRSLKANYSAPDAPVIVFGGSYGGMLAFWAREKYPQYFQGAWASSAPVLQIPGIMPPGAYNNVILNTFAQVLGGVGNPAAPQGIWNAFNAMLNMSTQPGGLAQLETLLRMCPGTLNVPSDVWTVIYYFESAIGFAAMADYPAPADFLGPLPAWPASVMSSFFPPNPTTASNAVLLEAMAAGVGGVFYNYSGQAGTCFNTTSLDPPGLQGNGWDIQCCREVAQPIGSYGWPNDFFPPQPFNLAGFIAGCQAQFNGTTPRPYLQQLEYGGLDVGTLSNTYMPNGSLDPWHSGGFITNVTAPAADVIAFVIENGAHHLDLRAPEPATDPDSVVVARNIGRAAIRRWSDEYLAKRGKPCYFCEGAQ